VEELDRDFRWRFFHRTLHFLSGVCESVRVDVNSDPTSPAAHVIAQLKTSDRLLKLVPALWALKSDHKCIGANHPVFQ
jgi:hypothetical protein